VRARPGCRLGGMARSCGNRGGTTTLQFNAGYLSYESSVIKTREAPRSRLEESFLVAKRVDVDWTMIDGTCSDGTLGHKPTVTRKSGKATDGRSAD